MRRPRRPRQPPAPSLDRARDPRRAPRLLGADLQLRRRNGRIRLAGRWIAFPLRPADLVRRLPPAFALGAAARHRARPVPPRGRGHVRGRAPGRARAHHVRALLLPLRAEALGGRAGRAGRGAGAAPGLGRLAAEAGGARAPGAARGKGRVLVSAPRLRAARGRRWPRRPRTAGADIRLGAAAERSSWRRTAWRSSSRTAVASRRHAVSRRSRCRRSPGSPAAPDGGAARPRRSFAARDAARLPRPRARPLHAVRRPLPARGADARHARVGAEELPRRRRPRRAHGALRRDPVPPRRRAVAGDRRRAGRGRRPARSSRPACPSRRRARSWCAACPRRTRSTGSAGSGVRACSTRGRRRSRGS